MSTHYGATEITVYGVELVIVSKLEYEGLKDACRYLDCLREAGVDNWVGYDYANDLYYGSEDADE